MNIRFPKITLHRVALYICLAAFFIWANILGFKYFHFGYTDWDFGIFAHAMWNLSHGNLYSSLLGSHFFANHANYISLLLAPLFWIFPSALTLIVFKILSYTCGAYILFLLTAKKVDAKTGIILMILYLIFPPNIYAMLFEFDFESLSLVCFFLLFYFMAENKLMPFLITIFLASLIKENIPLVMITLGIYNLIGKKENKIGWGIAPILMGAAIFCTAMFIITPSVRPESSQSLYWGLFNSMGGTPDNILKTILLKPYRLFEIISTDKLNPEYIRDLFGPLIFTIFTGPHILFVAIPLFLQNLTSNSFAMHTIRFHYAATIVPFIFLATLPILKIFKQKIPVFFYNGLLIILILSSLLNVHKYWPKFAAIGSDWNDSLDPFRWKVVKEIPPKAGVVTTFQFLPELSTRKDLYSFHYIFRGFNQTTAQPFVLPESVNYALIDFNDMWVLGGIQRDPLATSQRIHNFFLRSNWVVKDRSQDIVLFKKSKTKTVDDIPLVQRHTKTPMPLKYKTNILIDNIFRLNSFEGKIISRQDREGSTIQIPLKFQWECKKQTADIYQILFLLDAVEDETMIESHCIGYGIYPTNLWKKGEWIEEEYSLLLPKLKTGTYRIMVFFNNINKSLRGQIILNDNKVLEENDAFVFLKFTTKPN